MLRGQGAPNLAAAGDFSEDMRRGGAAGDDWSDWEAHLPSSPDEAPAAAAAAAAVCCRRSRRAPAAAPAACRAQTSDKFEAVRGWGSGHKICFSVLMHPLTWSTLQSCIHGQAVAMQSP